MGFIKANGAKVMETSAYAAMARRPDGGLLVSKIMSEVFGSRKRKRDESNAAGAAAGAAAAGAAAAAAPVVLTPALVRDMDVEDLRVELEKRNLSAQGRKHHLVQRLISNLE